MSTSLLDPRIKLRHISCFLEVNRQGGVVAASQALGLSQPAVSKSIAELETLLQTALFDRTGRKLVLTRQGEMFARHAMAAAAAIREGIESVDLARSSQAVVRLGALPTVEVDVVPRAVASFRRSPFACRVHVESGPSGHMLAMLRDGKLDFIVGRLPSPDVMKGLVFEHLYSEQLTFAVRPQHPLAQRPDLAYRELEPYPLLLPPANAIIRPIVDSLFIAGGMGTVRFEIETVSNSFARAFALENDAIWTISHSVVARDLDIGQLVALALDTSASRGPVGITMRANEQMGAPVMAMMDAVRDATAQFPRAPS
ncbi:LysR family transcriptional regulator, pca operon transcriptional activator [Devosia enhydra]|uniref:LysR family transcriptional regulator, pca operon transcriptional activator n=1 Tax=Devosia enhydra TaxID=665118 RepID=A0A1K2I393_9HYPH|nr:pca operon transcription factor PcaQ [Devosia enhydra]SFZ86858.1 LysR family transcriptional regulator, pca operon transcriptional activator [Devosia enhydra]